MLIVAYLPFNQFGKFSNGQVQNGPPINLPFTPVCGVCQSTVVFLNVVGP